MHTTKVYGAPGTGKTTWMLNTLEKELDKVPLNRIAFVTHTVSAKLEALERIENKMGAVTAKDLGNFKTIHGICFKQLALHKSNVLKGIDFALLADELGVPFSSDFTYEVDLDGMPTGFGNSRGNQVLSGYHFAAANMAMYSSMPDIWPTWADQHELYRIITGYKKYKQHNSKLDFTDMLQIYLDKGHPLDIDVLFIDEAQDLSKLQWAVVTKFSERCKRIYIAGDDDQAIYSFLGADPDGFLKHPSDEDIVLPRTYRLKSNIWDFSKNIISEIHNRKEKNIEVDGKGGDIDYINMDIKYVPLSSKSSTMIIARHNNQLSHIRKDLEDRGVLYTYRGKPSVGKDRAEIFKEYLEFREGKDINYLIASKIQRMSGNKSIAKILLELFNSTTMEPIDSETLAKKYDFGLHDHPVSWMANNEATEKANSVLWAVFQEKGLNGLIEPPKVDLTTYHGSKGREADTVILLTDCYGKVWRSQFEIPEQEIKVSYVGATRAKNSLVVILPKTQMYLRSLVS